MAYMHRSRFAEDILKGLSANPKYLLPKYLYDTTGSCIFRNIMDMPEYYLTSCEYEIFTAQKESMRGNMFWEGMDSCIIELGAGDGLKTKVLLRYFIERHESFTYIPIDICDHAVQTLTHSLRTAYPGLRIEGKVGDYFHVMHELTGYDSHRKIILFLGSNIGNYDCDQMAGFLRGLRCIMKKDDRLLIGFDLKKNPREILGAYNDPHGHTRDFNLNILVRINRELDADFDPGHFIHYENYDPASGAAKSYIISTREQAVSVKRLGRVFQFGKWEPMNIEMSQKFDINMIRDIATENGFDIVANYYDSRRYFVNSLWMTNE